MNKEGLPSFFVPELVIGIRHPKNMNEDALIRAIQVHRLFDIADFSQLGERVYGYIAEKALDQGKKQELAVIKEGITAAVKELNTQFQESLQASILGLKAQDIQKVDCPSRPMSFVHFVFPDSGMREFVVAVLSAGLTLRAGQESFSGEEVEIFSVSPNWALIGSPNDIIVGDPIGLPVPENGFERLEKRHFSMRLVELNDVGSLSFPKRRRVIKANKILTSLLAEGNDADPAGDGRDKTHVFILDTAPDYQRLMGAFDAFQDRNVLVKELLDPKRVINDDRLQSDDYLLQLKAYDYAAHNDKEFKLFEDLHDYDMADHGIFLTGLIHSMTKRARLHLYQVLNDKCVGTFRSLIWGLNEVCRVMGETENREAFVINCSLTTRTPIHDGASSAEEPLHQAMHYLNRLLLQGLDTLLNEIKASYPNCVIIAAAGNDSKEGEQRQEAGIPAIFASAIGVGALTRDWALAEYTNQADLPAESGYLAFGGNICEPFKHNGTKIRHACKRHGVLGLYTNAQCPPGTIDLVNQLGAVRWCGTSFSTGIVSGLFALLFAHGLVGERAVKVLNNAVIGMPERLGSSNYIPLKQGE